MKSHLKKLLAGSLAAALCMLSGCTSAPDTRDDPLSGYNVNSLPFGTRVPDAVQTTASSTQTPVPGSTDIVSLPQDWQNESAPENDNSTDAPTRIPTQVPTQIPTAPPAPTATRPAYTYTKLEQGDEGEEVIRLQARLIELGYLSGTADGVYGAGTKNAVKRFQKALGISQTGVAYVSLQEKLFMNTAPTYQPEVAPTGTLDPNANALYTVLVRGDKGEDVRKLQARLIALGYLSGTADGDFGANTENAVKRFQSVLGVSQTGVASVAMQSQLFSNNAPYAPAPTTAPTPVPTPTPAPTVDPYQQLEPGDTGEAVKQMQTRLNALGYFSGSATGNYYRETTAAVQLFQKAIGHDETGIATSAMLRTLYSSSAPTYSPAAQPEPTHSGGGYTDLRRGSSGTEVLNLQKRLIALGYLSGTADGSFGKNTEDAVKLFQQTVGFEQNGIASVGLQNLLFSNAAPTYIPAATSVPTPIPTNPAVQTPTSRYQQLEPGATGEAVKQMQARLKELGFFAGQLGGNYLTKTTASVKLFQAAINHAQTGIATPEMLEILFSDNAPDYLSVENDYITLEKLDSGIQVLLMQQRLKELGYLTGTADGDFGSQTEAAVKAFQQQAGLEATGKATPETQTILFSSVAPKAPVPTQAPTQLPTQVPTNVPTQVPTNVPTQVPTNVPEQTGYRHLQHGAIGEDVKALQTRLKQLGYYYASNTVTGQYYDQTVASVKLFQAQVGYPTDGTASVDLQELLHSAAAPAFDGSAYIELSEGMVNPAVTNLQRALIAGGYLDGEIDSSYGPSTRRAVRRFQQALGWEENGIASIELQRVLFSGELPANTPVPTQIPTQAPTQPPVSGSTYTTITYGSSGDKVIAIQTRLMELGYYNGLLKGNYLGITELAVQLFQAQAGYAPDGIATPELQELLFSSSAPYYTGTAFVDLEKGDEGIAVQTLQQRLISLGYLTGTADGEYGDGTASAVKKFQQAIGYGSTSGAASADLQNILFSDEAPAYNSGSTIPDQPIIDNPVVTQAPSIPDAPVGDTDDTDVTGSYKDYRTMQNGNSGEDVKNMQRRLKELGYFDGDLGGNYLTKTETAVKKFQTAVGLEPDGIATPELQMRIFSSLAPAYAAAEAPEQYDVLSKGDTGNSVKLLQKRLIQLGWLTGSADGDFGNATEQALLAFQYRIGLETDGIAGIELQDRLYAENAPHYMEYVDLAPGAKGDRVLQIQLRLIELGYLNASAANLDGIYGNGLTNALIELQRASGMDAQYADGIATIELQTFLFSENAAMYARY